MHDVWSDEVNHLVMEGLDGMGRPVMGVFGIKEKLEEFQSLHESANDFEQQCLWVGWELNYYIDWMGFYLASKLSVVVDEVNLHIGAGDADLEVVKIPPHH